MHPLQPKFVEEAPDKKKKRDIMKQKVGVLVDKVKKVGKHDSGSSSDSN
jgi:hypothetical protein